MCITESLCCTPEIQHCKSTIIEIHIHIHIMCAHTHTHIYSMQKRTYPAFLKLKIYYKNVSKSLRQPAMLGTSPLHQQTVAPETPALQPPTPEPGSAHYWARTSPGTPWGPATSELRTWSRPPVAGSHGTRQGLATNWKGSQTHLPDNPQ